MPNKNEIERVELFSSQVELSEVKSDPDILQAKFLISGFGVNKNKVQINRDTIDSWVSTLVGKPLVGKVSTKLDGTMDFESHNLKVITKYDENGVPYKEAEFDTNGFGCFTSAGIEKIDGIEYITATANIWKRFKNAVSVIKDRVQNGTLQTSWEISVEDSTSKIVNGTVVKIINAGRFIGHCLLGSDVEPAYDESGLLQVASKGTSQELSTALSQDCLDESLNNINKANLTDKEVKSVKKDKETLENSTEQEVTTDVETEDSEKKKKECSDTETDTTDDANGDNDSNDGNTEPELQEPQNNPADGEENGEDIDSNATDDDDNKKKVVSEETDETETSALTDRDLRNKITKAYEEYSNKYGYIWLCFPIENVAWIDPWDKENETDYVEVKYTVDNDEVTITEATPVSLVASPREINEQIASKNSAIAEMSTQITNLTNEIAELKPYKEKIDELERAEKEAQLEKDRKELSEYAISSGYITEDEIENSEEIKTMISELDKAGIKSIISDRVVEGLNKNKDVETSEKDNSKEKDIKVNLSAVETSSKDSKVSAKEAQSAIRKYLGRK
nr:MAG TPA: hypothetical protein [Caudoviricetes sp.]